MKASINFTCPCSEPRHVRGFFYRRPPKRETSFNLKKQKYQRGYLKCRNCGHWFSQIEMDFGKFYHGAYVKATYGQHLKKTFDKILALPRCRSDNRGRVARVKKFLKQKLPKLGRPRLLDVGSGLAVFPFRMKAEGCSVTALDPDARAVEHAKENAGLKTIHADFLKWRPKKHQRFHIVTINKVLEHVKNPVSMLLKAKRLIRPGGLLYVEVPDANAAVLGKNRQEFFIEHLHVFSSKSLLLTLEKSGWSVSRVQNIREPSGKMSILAFAFCAKKT